MTKENNYLVYNPELDKFIRVKKLSKEQFKPFFSELRELTKDDSFTVGEYRAHLCFYFIKETDKILKDLRAEFSSKEEFHSVASEIVASLADGVTQVYSFLGITSVTDALNNLSDKEDDTQVTFGQTKTDKTFNNLSSIERLRKRLKSRIVGQNEAIEELVKFIKLKSSGLNTFTTHFFIGPTGVGKTELGKALAEEYFGSKKRLLKINCGEYSSSHEYAKLLGSPPGYVGHQEKALLQEKADESNEWVIIFDEIEKAHHKLHDVLLNLLDEGTITDSHGTVLDFSKSIILMTSNIGVREFVGKTSVGFGGEETKSYEEAKSIIDKEFKERFSPEFVNRIQSTVYFNELSESDAKKITRKILKEYPVTPNLKLVNYISKKGFSKEYGARNIKRFINSEVAVLIAEAILKYGKGKVFAPEFNKEGSLDSFSPEDAKKNVPKSGAAGL
jgi:ATP-dependent Clp protease ATP-binding subunit ClpA